jgi:hypothetical protein
LFGRWIDPLVYLPTSMKTIWDTNTYQEVVRRFESLQPNTRRQWGKMSVAQMLEHNARVLEVVTGNTPMKQALVETFSEREHRKLHESAMQVEDSRMEIAQART